jgi:hypothetical protein
MGSHVLGSDHLDLGRATTTSMVVQTHLYPAFHDPAIMMRSTVLADQGE